MLLILVGEPAGGPASARTWVYLAFIPIGFSAGYLFAACHLSVPSVPPWSF